VGGRQEIGRWKRIGARDNWTCWICGGGIDPALSTPHRLAGTVDHVVEIMNGGSDDDANVRAAHLGCNSRRSPGRTVQLAQVFGVV